MLVGSQQPAADASDDALDASVQGPNAPARQRSEAPIPLALDRLTPLPEIRNEALARQALTHKRNLHNEVKSPYAAEVGSYRQLERLGDKVLGSPLARVLTERFPDAPTVILNTLHDKLGSDFTWPQIAQAYGPPSRMVEAARPDQRPALEVIVHQQYVVADLFEAHFGALSKESGNNTAYDWVQAAVEAGVFPTLGPHARTEIEDLMARRSASHVQRTRSYEMDQDLPVPRRRAVDYSQCIRLQEIRHQWILDHDHDAGFHVQLVSEGKEIACGRGRKANNAREDALERFLARDVQ